MSSLLLLSGVPLERFLITSYPGDEGFTREEVRGNLPVLSSHIGNVKPAMNKTHISPFLDMLNILSHFSWVQSLLPFPRKPSTPWMSGIVAEQICREGTVCVMCASSCSCRDYWGLMESTDGRNAIVLRILGQRLKRGGWSEKGWLKKKNETQIPLFYRQSGREEAREEAEERSGFWPLLTLVMWRTAAESFALKCWGLIAFSSALRPPPLYCFWLPVHHMIISCTYITDRP